ncbi:MAG: tetratricopeptide repeat protein [candidate division Zixibacteria bacterium]|nr:tetratricopeptide repeat protein [candidate division Zixibacteria bacterium]
MTDSLLLFRFFGPFLLLILLAGCPYYNTFYNAKKAFNEAERIRKETSARGNNTAIPDHARTLYERALENAGLIIRDHPGSDLVDNALVLIGDVFSIQKDHAKAARKYEEVIANYPESDWIPYCLFALGKASLNAADTTHAKESLRVFLQRHPRSRWSPEAYMLLGAISVARQDYPQAIERYTEFITAYPKHENRSEAEYYMAVSLLETGRYEDALTLFRCITRTGRTPELRFNAHFMAGESLQRNGNHEEALKVFENLLGKDEYEKYYPKIMLALAGSLYALRQTDQAIDRYGKIQERYEKERDYAAEVSQAGFELGALYERQVDLKKAEEYYAQAEKRSPQQFWVGKRAEARSKDIRDLQKYRDNLSQALATLTPPDSAHAEALADFKLRTEVVSARFRLAEHYLFRLNLPDSALVHYRLIQSNTSQPEIAAQAAYACAWIMEHVMRDTLTSRAGYETLLKEYGQTVYGAKAARMLSVPDPNGFSDDRLFTLAEHFLLDIGQPDSAAWYYRQVLERYPRGEYAPRALWATGWIDETYRGEPDSALNTYRRLKEMYPESPLAKQAETKIRQAETLFAELNPTSQDSTAAKASVSDASSPRRGPDKPKDLVLTDVGRQDAHGTVETIEEKQLAVKLIGGRKVETGTTGYVYTIETQDANEVAVRVADIRVLAVTVSLEGKTVMTGMTVDLYDKPDGEVISAIVSDTPVDIKTDQGDWVKVFADGQEGFALKALLAGTDDRIALITCRVTRTYASMDQKSWLGVRFNDTSKIPDPP